MTAKSVTFQSATGNVMGYLARPAMRERLPAVLIIHDKDGLTAWMKQNTREIASVGYVALAVDLQKEIGKLGNWEMTNERALAKLWAAVRWLRRRADVDPNRVGVVGWGWGGQQALALAASTPLQACVICDSSATTEPPIIAGLRRTTVLGVFAGNDRNAQRTLSTLRKALQEAHVPHKIHVYDGVRPGFMCPANRQVYAKDAAGKAWFEIYEFLGKYVEDADLNAPAATPAFPSVATIADIMRAVNVPTGVRGALMQSLEKEPSNEQEWNLVRARAALIAEAGYLLQTRTPRKGTHESWIQRAKAYTQAAEALVTAADKRDYATAQRGLQQLALTCGACHERHR